MKFIFVVCCLLGSVLAAQVQVNNDVAQKPPTYVEQSYPDQTPIIQREGEAAAKSKIRYFVWE